MRPTPSPRTHRLATARALRSPAEIAARDRQLREAFLAMRPLLKRGAPLRYLFDDVARQNRTCWQQVATAMELAADHGVPLHRLRAFGEALCAYADSLDAARQTATIRRPLGVQLMTEAELDAAADVAQARLLAEGESPSTLHAVIETAKAHAAHYLELIRTGSARMFQHRQTGRAS